MDDVIYNIYGLYEPYYDESIIVDMILMSVFTIKQIKFKYKRNLKNKDR